MEIKIRTRQELAEMYDVDVKTLKKWVEKKEVALDPGAIYPAKQDEIVSKLGIPPYPDGNPNKRKPKPPKLP